MNDCETWPTTKNNENQLLYYETMILRIVYGPTSNSILQER